MQQPVPPMYGGRRQHDNLGHAAHQQYYQQPYYAHQPQYPQQYNPQMVPPQWQYYGNFQQPYSRPHQQYHPPIMSPSYAYPQHHAMLPRPPLPHHHSSSSNTRAYLNMPGSTPTAQTMGIPPQTPPPARSTPPSAPAPSMHRVPYYPPVSPPIHRHCLLANGAPAPVAFSPGRTFPSTSITRSKTKTPSPIIESPGRAACAAGQEYTS